MKISEMTLEQIVEELNKNENDIFEAKNLIESSNKKLGKAEKRRYSLLEKAKKLRVNGLPITLEGFFDGDNDAIGCPSTGKQNEFDDETEIFEVDLSNPFTTELYDVFDKLIGKYIRIKIEEVPVDDRMRCVKCARRFECMTTRK